MTKNLLYVVGCLVSMLWSCGTKNQQAEKTTNVSTEIVAEIQESTTNDGQPSLPTISDYVTYVKNFADSLNNTAFDATKNKIQNQYINQSYINASSLYYITRLPFHNAIGFVKFDIIGGSLYLTDSLLNFYDKYEYFNGWQQYEKDAELKIIVREAGLPMICATMELGETMSAYSQIDYLDIETHKVVLKNISGYIEYEDDQYEYNTKSAISFDEKSITAGFPNITIETIKNTIKSNEEVVNTVDTIIDTYKYNVSAMKYLKAPIF